MPTVPGRLWACFGGQRPAGFGLTPKGGGVSGWLRCGQAQSPEYGLRVASSGRQ